MDTARTDGPGRQNAMNSPHFANHINRNVSLGLIVQPSLELWNFNIFLLKNGKFLSWTFPPTSPPPFFPWLFSPDLCGENFLREVKVFCGCEKCRQRYFYRATVEAAFSVQQQFGDLTTL